MTQTRVAKKTMANNVPVRILTIDTEIKPLSMVIPCELEMSQGGRLPEYEGDYQVTSDLVKQTLATKNRSLMEDIIVHPVPIEYVENRYGGTTVIICGTSEIIAEESGELEDGE